MIPCRNKQAFASRAEAKETARHFAKASTKKGTTHPMRAYLCPVCGLWHLTRLSKVEARRIERKKGLR